MKSNMIGLAAALFQEAANPGAAPAGRRSIFALPSRDELMPVVEHVKKYSEAQAQFTQGTRRDGSGWTSMTFEWGKRNAQNQQMISLEQSLQKAFPDDCIAVGGALRLLEIAAQVTGEIRVQERGAQWTPKRGRNQGLVQSGRLHDVFFPGAQTRQLYDPFSPTGTTPFQGNNPTGGGLNPAQGNDVAGDPNRAPR